MCALSLALPHHCTLMIRRPAPSSRRRASLRRTAPSSSTGSRGRSNLGTLVGHSWLLLGGSWLGLEVRPIRVQEQLPTGRVLAMMVIDGLPCVFQELMCFGYAGGGGVSFRVQVGGGMGTVGILDVAVVLVKVFVRKLGVCFVFGGDILKFVS